MQRFWSKVDKTVNCWNWIGANRGNGYGCFKYKNKVYDAHRFVWYLVFKKFPTQWILHKCNNKKCVNPDHIYEGSAKQNYADMLVAGNAYKPIKIYKSKKEQKRASFMRWYKKVKLEPGQARYKKWRETQKCKIDRVV